MSLEARPALGQRLAGVPLATVARGPLPAGARYKEWFHFCVHAGPLRVVINLNLSAAGAVLPAGRLVALWTSTSTSTEGDPGWQGRIDSFPAAATHARRARLDVRLGGSSLQGDDQAMHLLAVTEDQALRVDLVLSARTFALHADSALPGGGQLHWVAIPRLEANGVVEVDGQRLRLRAAPVYHDHNWGGWAWGDDFAWQWGYALPASVGAADRPITLVASRLLDRAGLRERDRRLSLWRGERLSRLFAGEEVEWQPAGRWHGGACRQLPPVMALLAGGEVPDLPARLTLSARQAGAWLRAEVVLGQALQLLVPNETDLGTTSIAEVLADWQIEGVVDDQPIAARCSSVLEFVHAG